MLFSRLCLLSTVRFSGLFFAGLKVEVFVSLKCKKFQRLLIFSRRNFESVLCILFIKGFLVDLSSWLIFFELIFVKQLIIFIYFFFVEFYVSYFKIDEGK